MGHNTSVALNDHFKSVIDREVSEGRYETSSDVIRAGLRLLEEKRREHDWLRQEIEKGEKSGFIEDFDGEAFLQELKAETNP